MLTNTDEKRLLKTLSRVFLNDYPNPERRGCPGSDILKAIASRRLTLEEAEPWINHLCSCSPCTREFTNFRKNFQRQRILRLSSIAAGLLLIVAVSVWLLLRGPAGPAQFQAATLDLTDRAILRGPEENPPKPPLQLPRGNLNLNVYLPVGSEPGKYEIEVVDRPGNPLVKSEGSALLQDHIAVLRVYLNLESLRPGLYLVGIRQAGWSWTYYPMVLK